MWSTSYSERRPISNALPEYSDFPPCMKYRVRRSFKSSFAFARLESSDDTSASQYSGASSLSRAMASFKRSYRFWVRRPRESTSSSRATSTNTFFGAWPAILLISSTMPRAWLMLLRNAGEPGRSSRAKPSPSSMSFLFSASIARLKPKASS